MHASSANFNENDNKNIKTMNLSVNEHDILHKIHENKGIYIRLLVLVLEKQGLKVGLCNQNIMLVAIIFFIHIIMLPLFRLGHGDLVPDNPTLVPCRVEILHMLQMKVISVSCGAEHTVALTHQGVSII